MAQLVIAAAGAVAGNALGWGIASLGLSGAAVGWQVGSLLANVLIKPPAQQGPRLGDLRVSGTEYGQPVPWVAGSPRLAGQVVWASSKREIPNTQKVGKGGGQKVTTFTYEVDLLILLTENPIVGVSRVWSNGDLVYNGAVTKDGVWNDLRIYTGADDQLPDPTYEAAVGVGNAPAYRGRGYVLVQGLQLGNSGQIPNLTFEVGTSFGVLDVSPFVERSASPTLAPFNSGAGASLVVETPNNYLLSVGQWNNSYARTDAVVYRYNAITNAWSNAGSFNHLSALENSSIGNSDVAQIAVIGSFTGPSNIGRAYILPGGTSSHFTLGRVPWPVASGNSVYCIAEGAVYYCLRGVDSSNRIFKNLVNAPTSGAPAPVIATSAVYSSFYFTQLRVIGDELFCFTLGGGTPLMVLDKNDLTFKRSITNPFDRSNQTWGIVGNTVVGIGTRNTSTVFAREIYALNPNETWRLLGTFTAAEDFIIETSDNVPNITLTSIGSSIVIGRYVTNAGLLTYRIAVAEIENFGVFQGEPQPLTNVLNSLLERAGLRPEDYEVQGFDPEADVVRGAAVGQLSNTRGIIEAIQPAFVYTASKTNRIIIRPRSTTPVATIPYAELNTRMNFETEDGALTLEKSNDLAIPRQVAVSFNNVAADYVIATEYSDRLLSGQESTQDIQLPIGLTPEEGKRAADRMLFDLVASNVTTVLNLPLKYAFIEPSDVFDVVDQDGRTYRFQCRQKTDSMPMITLECTLDDVGALDSSAITDTGYISTDTVRQLAPTDWVSLDIPLLRDEDDSAGWYAGVWPNRAAPDDEWPGAAYVKSTDDVTYEQVAIIGEGAAVGLVAAALPDYPRQGRLDTSSVIDVTMLNGEVSASTLADILAQRETNVFLVGDEVIQAYDVTLLAPGQYRIRNMIRGLRGTERAMATHVPNERFVVLDARLRNATHSVGDVGNPLFVKGVTLNKVLDSVTAENFTDTGVRLRPFSVAQLRVVAAGADMQLSWERRTRAQYRYSGDNPVVPLGELSEAYRVQVFDGAALVRTVEVTSPTYTYAAADAAADGFASADTVTFTVAQLSSSIGPGYPATTQGVLP